MAPEAAGVGIDLLEIDRLERALERRPRLAERLFTDAERAYAAARARPGTAAATGTAPGPARARSVRAAAQGSGTSDGGSAAGGRSYR